MGKCIDHSGMWCQRDTIPLSDTFPPVSMSRIPTYSITACAAVVDVRGQVFADTTTTCQYTCALIGHQYAPNV